MEHIFILNINQLKDGDTFRYYFNEMSRERQNKIMQFKMEADRLRSLGAGIALHAILKQYGINPRETCLEYGTNGKASVAGRPDIHFNLTHSGCYAAGVCGAAPVGIDIEEIGLMKVKVARRFFHDGEYRYLEQMEDGQQKQEAFFRLWVLKESFMKVTGLGMALPLNAFEIRFQGQDIEVVQELDDIRYYFKEFSLENSRMAVCSAGRPVTGWEPVWIRLDTPGRAAGGNEFLNTP